MNLEGMPAEDNALRDDSGGIRIQEAAHGD